MNRIATLLLFAGMLFAGTAAAASLKTIQYEDGEAVPQKPGYAYVIVRQIVRKENFATGFVFVRALATDELNTVTEGYKKDRHFEPASNVVELWRGDTYSRTGDEYVYVLAVQPGTYVLGEQSFGINGVCMCMGTVKFEAKEGQLTDLGYLLAARNDKPSTIPELANVVQKMELDDDLAWMMIALRPATEATAVPDKLKAFPRVLADYRAVNKFPNYFGAYADRLVAVPGILGYDTEGHVLDLKSGGPAASVLLEMKE
jgi:hypothetical protein